MALLIQLLILLTAPGIASWDMANASSPYPPTPEAVLAVPRIGLNSDEVAGPKQPTTSQQHRTPQQHRMDQLGVRGVIYFDAPLSNAQRRIVR